MQQRYNYAFFDEASKREIRRAIVKGVSIPGYQVPFASREMPIGRGWGTGGLQITLAVIGRGDVLKVIDQGSDDSVNAVNIKKLVADTTDVEVTDATEDATLIQSRHRIPERPLRADQVLVLQVPTPEPLRGFEPSEAATRRLHAEADYTGAWLELFDQIVRFDATTTGADHPVLVNGRYVMAPSPIPRFDNLKLNQAEHLTLLGAGREKKIYAVPPHTDVVPLDFEDYPFAVANAVACAARRASTWTSWWTRQPARRTTNATTPHGARNMSQMGTVPIWDTGLYERPATHLLTGKEPPMLDDQRFGADEAACLSVRNLSKRFGAGCPHCLEPDARLERNVCPRCGTVHAVRDVSLDVYPAEIVGIVGESGSGKSSLMKCLFFDEEATSGDVRARPFDGGAANLLALSPQQRRAIRNTVFGMVYQNPYLGLRMDFSSLSNIAEQMIASGSRNVGAMRSRGEDLLGRVNIPLSRATEPPRNFSGGMQQRVQIAKALSNNPPILLLDEVTTGLDLSVQAAVLDLVQQIRRDFNVSMLVVSHDLGVIRMLADRTLVMLDGRVIESGLTDQILEDPQHSYTQQLVYSLL